MRQQIDCAVLSVSPHRDWLNLALKQVEPAMARIRLHYLDWESQPEHQDMSNSPVHVDIQAFAKSGVSLRRFDVCLLPVSIETLGWTRQALAAIPRGPFVPLIGIFSGLRSAAMQDLLELGLADFVRLPLCPDEYRARILSTVSKVPRPGNSLREPALLYGGPSGLCNTSNRHSMLARSSFDKSTLSKGHKLQSKNFKSNLKTHGQRYDQNHELKNAKSECESFRLSKANVVEQFEREYVTRALELHNGNIAKAARASNKHRRAFWALMRKYQIDAGLYRPDDDEE